jgi:biotin-dependent carboxylase-like uncharacterized protein
VIEVLSPGLLTTIQDLGRPGWASIGVPPSGAVDRESLELGNSLVGNPPGAAALEATLVGPRLVFRTGTLIALTGAVQTPQTAEVEGEVDVGELVGGARAYVCVRGGIEVQHVLGSRSTDLLTGLGPKPLEPGDVLEIGADPGRPPAEPRPSERRPARALRVVPGPRDDWFDPEALNALTTAEWRVTPAANRVGIRLSGPMLGRVRTEELLSEGLVTGAIQVPPNGQPILLLNDHPTTGGYPVIAVVAREDLSRVGQLRPGDTVRFGAEWRS